MQGVVHHRQTTQSNLHFLQLLSLENDQQKTKKQIYKKKKRIIEKQQQKTTKLQQT